MIIKKRLHGISFPERKGLGKGRKRKSKGEMKGVLPGSVFPERKQREK